MIEYIKFWLASHFLDFAIAVTFIFAGFLIILSTVIFDYVKQKNKERRNKND